MSVKNFDKLIDTIVEAMREQAKEANTNKAEVDISGGVDSAVIVALSCIAFGKENVIGVYSSINSSPESLMKARLVSDKFGFKLVELDLSQVYETIVEKVYNEFNRLGLKSPSIHEDPTICGGFRSCLRAPVGRFVNRWFRGGIREGTGNRDEDELIRFFQKGGDGEVDSNWIEGLFKGEVWELAEYLGVPKEVIESKPTPDLWGGQHHTDEDELKKITGVDLTYTRPGGQMGTIEWASRENAKNNCVVDSSMSEKYLKEIGYDDNQVSIILALRKLEKSSRHKSVMPPHISRVYLEEIGVVE